MSGNPKISVLTAVDDHPPPGELTFEAMFGQTLPPGDYEWIIVGHEPPQYYLSSLAKIMQRKPPELRLHFETDTKPGRASAYNRGLALCWAPLILFFGDDFIANPKTVEAHLDFHRQASGRKQVGIGAALLGAEHRTHFTEWLERSGALYGVPFHADMTAVPTDFFYGGNTSIRRDFLDETGPFDEDYRYHAGDDYELGLRLTKLGMTAAYVPGAKAEHFHSITLRDRCEVMHRAGQSAALLARKSDQPQLYIQRFESQWRYRARAAASRLQFSLRRREADLISYYRARLDGAFVAGYRQANGPAVSRQ